MTPGLVHAAPTTINEPTPCCGATPWELPPGDRATTRKSAVTCGTNCLCSHPKHNKACPNRACGCQLYRPSPRKPTPTTNTTR